MKRVFNKIFLLFFLIFLTAITLNVYSTKGISIGTGYSSNIEEVRGGGSSFYLMPTFYFFESYSNKGNYLISLNLYSKYFVDSIDSSWCGYDAFLNFKLDVNPNTWLFIVGSNGTIYGKDYKLDDNYSFYFSPQYLFEMDTLGFYIEPEVGVVYYPNNSYDNFYFGGRLKLLLYIKWVYKVLLSGGFKKEYYNSYYLYESITKLSNEKMKSYIFYCDLEAEYLILPYLSLSISGKWESKNSNGNYVYYGPNEIVPVIDGDEVLIKDYFSFKSYEFNFKIEYDFSGGQLISSISFDREYYNRMPETLLGLKLKDKMYINTLSLGVEGKFFINKNISLSFLIGINNKNSNDYWYDCKYYDISLFLDYSF